MPNKPSILMCRIAGAGNDPLKKKIAGTAVFGCNLCNLKSVLRWYRLSKLSSYFVRVREEISLNSKEVP